VFRLNKPTRQSLTAIALAALIAAVGCGRTTRDAERFDTRQFVADVAAFQDRPSEQTWEPLRIALLTTPAKVAVESSLVEVLAEAPVSERVLDAAAVDLATADWPGAMKWVRQYNVAARTQTSARGRGAASATARLAWLLLALRPGYAKDPVDLTHADLRDTAPFVGQAMNLTNVDFSGAVLSGGTWRSANVGGAQFSSASVAGTLRCANCTFGNVRYPGVVRLAGGQWAAP
jgi:hypothetical protein